MKRIVAFMMISIILLMSTSASNQVYSIKGEVNEIERIPEEALRLRILANSDEAADQQVKLLVRDEINKHIASTVADIDEIDDARRAIEGAIPRLEEIVQQTLHKENMSYHFDISLASDVPFPEKTYGPYIYPEGEYEALLVTLGEGLGKNWWCVLFPPLCFLDFFSERTLAEAEEEVVDEAGFEDEEEEMEVRFFLFDLFNLS